MFNRSKFIRFLGADPVKFAARFGLEPFTHPCRKCGADRETVIPFASGVLRGLIAEECCGELPCYCVVSAGPGDLLEEMGKHG